MPVSTYLIRLLHNTIFSHNAVTICVLVVATRGGKLLNGATAANADDPSVLCTAGVATIPWSASSPINSDESTWSLTTPVF